MTADLPWADPVWPDDVALQSDVSPSAWMLPRLLPSFLSGGQGMPVGAVVPSGFGGYVRVLHPADAPGGLRANVTWRQVAAWSGRTYHPLMQFSALSSPVAAAAPPFDGSPREGALGPDECRALYSALASWTSTPETCWLGIWEGWGTFGYPRSMSFSGGGDAGTARMERQLLEIARRVDAAPRFDHPARRYLLARSPATAICGLGRPPLSVTASLVWPDDRAWCVATEVDFDSTLVAASASCAAALLADTRLEAVPVHPEDRLDIEGDEINPPAHRAS